MSDKPDIEAIKARLAAAVRQGTWTYDSHTGSIREGNRWCPVANWVQAKEDADFIAHAPDDIAALLAEVERLQRERAEWRDRADALMTEQMTQMRDLQAEVAALRSLRDSVWSLGDTAQWRMRAEQRGYMVFCNAQDCADIADIQDDLAALDAAEGEGR